MSIRPVDFNGMIQNQHGVLHQKQQEDTKPLMQQQQALQTVRHQEQQHASQVERKPDSDARENKFDARDEGKNKYQDNRKKKKTAGKTEDGSVRRKGTHGGFDITV